jgi:outer membrane protein, heavy metal efflux system
MRIFNRRLSTLVLGVLFSAQAFAVESTGQMQSANPQLMAFVNSAVDRNPRVVAARALLDASRAREVAAAKPLFNPEIGFDADNGETNDRSVNLSQTIDWVNKREARTDVASSVSEVARENYLTIQRLVAGELLSGLSAYQTTREREALTSQRVSIMKDFASLSKRRFEQGDLNQVELSVASLAYMEARISHADLQVEMADAIRQVENIEPGISPERWPRLDTLQSLPRSDNRTLAAQLPLVRSARNLASTALAVIELQKRNRKPDPTIRLTGGKEEKDTLIGLGIVIPLYLRNNFKAEVDAATEDYRAAQKNADDVLQRAFSQLENTTRRYNLYYAAWNDWQATGLVDLNNQAQQLQNLWEAGEISTTDFLLQIQQTLDTRDSALILYRNVWQAWLEWLVSSGRIADWLEMEKLG